MAGDSRPRRGIVLPAAASDSCGCCGSRKLVRHMGCDACHVIALGRKDYLSAGSEVGGGAVGGHCFAHRNSQDECRQCAGLSARCAGHPISRLDEWLPFEWLPFAYVPAARKTRG